MISRNNLYFLVLLPFNLFFLTACDQFGGAFEKHPEDIKTISTQASKLIQHSLSDIQPHLLHDYHTHIVGLNPEGSGTFVNESWQSFLDPPGFVKFEVYKSASAVNDNNDIDQQFLKRLNELIKHLPYKGKFGILAFDYFHDEQGIIHKDLTTFHVPNNYVLNIVEQFPDRYFPILSIHPYRKDAIALLQQYANQGVRYIKWLPNAMGINPSPEKPALRQHLIDYYRVMKDNGMVLITHTGDEKATEAEEFQHLGNPIYLRLPLDMGVKVVMAHIGSLGVCKPEEHAVCSEGTPYIDIAIKMMQEEQYKDNLFADISALTQFNRLHALDAVIETTSIHENLINGSDYPLPAVNFVIQTRALVKSGHITEQERELINEIYDINPLLFDYVLKRIIKHSKTGKKLPASIFLKNEKLPDGQNTHSKKNRQLHKRQLAVLYLD